MQRIYVENSVKNHPRVQRILQRFPDATVIDCKHHGEVFNPKAQNFRLQKQSPALILAEKNNHRILPTPEGFGIGGHQNYYFSHMQNCIYDCRYCFLQGMYQSANYVVFVNYEDFMADISEKIREVQEPIYFFSGYDADSLAYEPVTQFVQEFLPFFAKNPKAILELRSKSANIRALLHHEPIDNCVVAFSFTPDAISREVEHKVPSVQKRIQAIATLAEQGWKIGLRLDPLIYATNFAELYQQLIADIFAVVPESSIHSVSLGPLRFPAKMYQKLTKLYPEDKLLAHPLQKRENTVSYSETREDFMKQFVSEELQKYLPKPLLFECSPL